MIKAPLTVAVILAFALTALAGPAEGKHRRRHGQRHGHRHKHGHGSKSKGFWGAIFGSSFVSSVEISSAATSEGSSEASSDSSSERSKPPDGVESARAAQRRYLADNYEAVMRDAAAGGGEHLRAMARLMGCADDVHARLFNQAKAQHHRIFAFEHGDGEVDIDATVSALRHVLAEDPTLMQRCSDLPRPPQSRAPPTTTTFTTASASQPPRRSRPSRAGARSDSRRATCHPQPL